MIEIVGWVCTGLVLIGYFFNSHGKQMSAFFVWIVGDLGWIWYDYEIQNWSHATLSTTIIFLNLYGIFKNRQNGPSKCRNRSEIFE